MAHNLNETNGKTSFVAFGEKAWHGLGQYVNEAMTAAQAIELGGLNYQVEKRPLYTVAGSTELGVELPDHKAVVRADTNAPLGIVSNAYEIVQNHEAFEFFDSIIEKGEAIYHTAGVLGAGEKIFVTAKLPSDIRVQDEKVENYLLLTAGHDGRTSIQAGFTSIRVVCNNTLTAALRGLANRVSIVHGSNAKQHLKDAARVMGMASSYTTELLSSFNKMADVKITDAQLRAYIETVMMPVGKEAIEGEEFSKQFTRQVNGIMEFAKTHETQQTDTTKNTVFGAYNAISGYFGWVKPYETAELRMKDVYFKQGAKRIEAAYTTASSLV